MSEMTNPANALLSFQAEIKRGMPVERCAINSELSVMYDEANGKPRYTYANIEWGKVKALALFVLDTPINDIPTFNIGYAVPEFYQNKGFGNDIVKKSIEELSSGLASARVRQIYIRAVIGLNNAPSNKIARKLISQDPEEIIDRISGEKAYHYVRLVEH
jgi:hypothetical protein